MLQVLAADKYGNVQVLVRDCSLHSAVTRKLIEEAPRLFLSDEQRQRIHDAARVVSRSSVLRRWYRRVSA